MPQKCFVLDAALFEKYSMEESVSIDKVFQNLINQGKCDWDTSREINSLFELLEAVRNEKAIICRNQKIIDKYSNYLDKIPNEIKDCICAILSDDKCSRIIDGAFKEEDFNDIRDTSLQDKEIYLDLAKALHDRVIVSTQEDKINIYTSNFNNKILFKHQILCKCTWEHWEEIKQRS